MKSVWKFIYLINTFACRRIRWSLSAWWENTRNMLILSRRCFIFFIRISLEKLYFQRKKNEKHKVWTCYLFVEECDWNFFTRVLPTTYVLQNIAVVSNWHETKNFFILVWIWVLHFSFVNYCLFICNRIVFFTFCLLFQESNNQHEAI